MALWAVNPLKNTMPVFAPPFVLNVPTEYENVISQLAPQPVSLILSRWRISQRGG